jgi:fibro-slime domain-containing protein
MNPTPLPRPRPTTPTTPTTPTGDRTPRRCFSGRSAPLACSALAAAAGLLTLDLVTTEAPAFAGDRAAAQPAAPETLPSELRLNAVVRDFRPRGEKGGHPDFQAYTNSFITTGLVEPRLDSENKPVFRSSRGLQISSEFRDASSRVINPAHFDPARGDKKGELTPVASNQLTSAADFAKWYRDDPMVNASKPVPLTFRRVSGTNRFVFDSNIDEPYKSRGGFFPIDNDLFGNYANTGKNFHFTTEIDTRFLFQRSRNHVFTFSGDDDVWVFIDNTLVLDLGGLHPRREQTVELNRLDWLRDGQVYTLRVFHAERRTTQSNFRIETTLTLVPAPLPPTLGLSD